MKSLSKMLTCCQCGDYTDTLEEGYCPSCCQHNQETLDKHNSVFDHWNKLTDKEKDLQIARAKNLAS